MTRRILGTLATAAAVTLSGATGGIAAPNDDCDWISTFGGAPGVSAPVHAMAVFDDGSGPALYAGGEFPYAGGVTVNGIGKWDGTSWSPLDSEILVGVSALAVFDPPGADSGPALYVGGLFYAPDGGDTFKGIAKWDGQTWTSVGGGVSGGYQPKVNAFTIFDDGSGPALYAGGYFETAGGQPANSIAKWDGESWAPLGSGVYGAVFALTVFDDGSGPALYAGGNFYGAGDDTAWHIAKWDGESWSSLGFGVFGVGVRALKVFDDGTGEALYVGGQFKTADGVPADNIARWNGTSWASVGSGIPDAVHALTVFDDGSGPALYSGGRSGITKWDGASWLGLGGIAGYNAHINALTLIDDGSGSALYAGGDFLWIETEEFNNIGKWDGESWSPLGDGLGDTVRALTVFDDGSGPALYAGGNFTTAGGVEANRIARWDGQSWSPLGSGMAHQHVHALTVFDDGSGPALYAGGRFLVAGDIEVMRIAKWDGESWSALGSGMNRPVYALTVFDDGTGEALYAGGSFSTAGGVLVNGIAKWDGTSWSPLGDGVGTGLSSVFALTVFDDGIGEALYAGGDFTTAGGVTANRIAKWDGESWSPLGSGMSGTVSALAVFDDGSGTALYAGGGFATAGDQTVNSIAKWEGESWSPLGSGTNLNVLTLTVFDNGSGEALYAGGRFTTAGGVEANRIAKWDGVSWSPLGSGMSERVFALTTFDDGSGPALYAGGWFTASPAGDSYLAKWGCPPTECIGDITGDGITHHADLAALLAAWDSMPGDPNWNEAADLDGDGHVHHTDLALLLSDWGCGT